MSKAGCSRVTHPSATQCIATLRSTRMCYARRQRSSWARIKLSFKEFIFRFLLTVLKSTFLYLGIVEILHTFLYTYFRMPLYDFSSLSLFSFQRSLRRSFRGLTSIPHPFPFVNTFFKVFWICEKRCENTVFFDLKLFILSIFSWFHRLVCIFVHRFPH